MLTHRDPWKAFICCILAFSVTACSTSSAPYMRRNSLTHRPIANNGSTLQTWGAESVDIAGGMNTAIEPGFLLTLHSIEDAKLNGDFQIDFDGNIQLPYDVTVNTTGMTIAQLEKKLDDVYRPYFKITPVIQVHIKERRYWLDVRGLVQKPGRYLVERTTSLDQLISMAGGLDKDTPPWFVRIQKGSDQITIDLNQYLSHGADQPQILGWLGGETVSFQREVDSQNNAPSLYRQPVFMLGEVRKPGEYPVKEGYDFTDYLTQADGFTQYANLDKIQLIRRIGNHRTLYEFTWDDFRQAPTPHGGDIVIVHSNSDTQFTKRFELGILTASLLTSIALVVVEARR